jgi:hypothetical protein
MIPKYLRYHKTQPQNRLRRPASASTSNLGKKPAILLLLITASGKNSKNQLKTKNKELKNSASGGRPPAATASMAYPLRRSDSEASRQHHRF